MVLAELGSSIQNAFKKLNRAQKIDKKLIDEILKEICNALMKADVSIKYVIKMRGEVEKKINAKLSEQEEGEASVNLRRSIIQFVVDELVKMLGSENKPYEFVKGKPNVVMFVGLQGAGKTTTCTKFAY